jgi:PHP family Zn ribbon phosphoesterase
MQIIADLQLHSRFSRAVSPEMTLPNIAAWAKRKGIGLVATGDWTHPMWFREIVRDLEEVGNGLLRLKQKSAIVANENLDPSSGANSARLSSKSLRATPSQKLRRLEKSEVGQNFIGSPQTEPFFLLATEVSSIFTQDGKGRRVHTLIWVPTIDSARKISLEMTKRGCNLMSDGRPIIHLSCIEIAELVFSIESKALVMPAHAWTPWFSTYGSKSGFNSMAEAFGEYADKIYAVETGLSSNPSMNWQIKELDSRSIVSFSDAHSGPKLGREATVFEIPEGKLSYDAIYEAIKGNNLKNEVENMKHEIKNINDSQSMIHNSKIAYTIEFYPEEGKYHYTGHRTCNIRYGPEETKAKGVSCPVCGKPLTQGVVQRVEELAGRSEADLQLESRIMNSELGLDGIKIIYSKIFPNRPPFVMLVPLQEIIAEAIGSPVASNKTQFHYQNLTDKLDTEFNILLHTSKEKITEFSNAEIAAGVEKVRTGDIVIDPGYDGVFGVVKIWKSEKEKALVDKSKEQLRIF